MDIQRGDSITGSAKTREYTLKLPKGGDALDRIECPMLVSVAAHSLYLKPEIAVKTP